MNTILFSSLFSMFFGAAFLSSLSNLLLVAATLFLIGMLLGWYLRANVREKELNAEISALTFDLQSVETEYAAMREEFNLQAADARKAALEVEGLQVRIHTFKQEQEINRIATETAQAQSAQDKTRADELKKSLQTLEEQVLGLRTQNALLLEKMNQNSDSDALISEIPTETIPEGITELEVEAITELAEDKTDDVIEETEVSSWDTNVLYEEAIAQLEKERNEAIASADEMASQVATLRNELAKADSDLAIIKVQLSRYELDLTRANAEVLRLEALQLEAMPSAAAETGGVFVDFAESEHLGEEVLDDVEVIEINGTVEAEDFIDDADELAEEGGAFLEEMDKIDSADAVLRNFVAIKTKLVEPAPLTWSDDLQAINGIAKTYEERLNKLGIFTFKQLADTKDDASMLEEISKALRVSVTRIENEDWAGQAQRFLENGEV